ncbi:glycosyltransferase [Sphingobacterium sp. lm-10]|uniref:glycosyltransferase family 2 protein n=1 Tax=Sphingobacterium sp. lm-10 TaxID=2944904 RepID=UPI0020218C3D|nr:glycosyltransferase family 2 protein [Sphingobacterium sp. lm-10]MCL7988415.1 glycosyltransferase [Sphingobacterium sp. lm-10]
MLTINPIVSIIIPVYNAYATLPVCLQSLKKLDYPYLQLIFIDDCSTDGSAGLIQRFIDSWTDAISKEALLIALEHNQGVAAARNTGIDHATGEYIYYVDADDELDPKTIREAVEAAEHNQSDIVGFNWYLAFKTNKRRMTQPAFTSATDALEKMMSGSMRWNLWLFLVKRALYEDNQIRFTPGMNMGEDLLVMIMLFSSTNKVTHLDQYLYLYRQSNSESLTKTYSEAHIEQVMSNVTKAIDFLGKTPQKFNLKKYAAFLKLNIKLPLLISGTTSQYKRWKTWFPEANEYAGKNPSISWRTRMLERWAFNEKFWAIRLYYYLVIRLVYGVIYK